MIGMKNPKTDSNSSLQLIRVSPTEGRRYLFEPRNNSFYIAICKREYFILSGGQGVFSEQIISCQEVYESFQGVETFDITKKKFSGGLSFFSG